MIHLLLGFLIGVTPFPTPPLIFFQKFQPLSPSPRLFGTQEYHFLENKSSYTELQNNLFKVF